MTPAGKQPIWTEGGDRNEGRLSYLDFIVRTIELVPCDHVILFQTREEGPQRQFRDHQGCLFGFKSGGQHLGSNRPDDAQLKVMGTVSCKALGTRSLSSGAVGAGTLK